MYLFNLHGSSGTDWVSLLVAVLGFLGAVLAAILAAYNNAVTKERAIWLQHFREEIGLVYAGILAAKKTESLSRSSDEPKKQGENLSARFKNETAAKTILDAEAARVQLISRLRSHPHKGNEHNGALKHMLEELDFSSENFSFAHEKEMLVLTNRILEREWDKTKRGK